MSCSMMDDSVFRGASVLTLMYGRLGSSVSSLTTYPIELMTNFLFDSFEMFVMFAMSGYSENEMIIVLGRSLLILMFSISGYPFWIFSIISSLLTNRMFLPLYVERSSIMFPLSCGVPSCSVEILIVSTYRY